MAIDLTQEVKEGFDARMVAGRCLEHGKPRCPYYATSPAAEGWEAGWAHGCNTLAGMSTGGVDRLKASAGRGSRVNITNAHGKHSYRLDYRPPSAGGGCSAYLEA